MKKILFVCLCLFLLSVGCSNSAGTNNQNNNSAVSGEEANSQKLSKIEFDELLKEQEMYVEKTIYLEQTDDDTYKIAYPDMLQAVIKNNTEFDIKNAIVAFVAWDENNLPIKIKGKKYDFSDGEYIKQVNYGGINLIPGSKYGDDSGYEIDDELNVNHFEAIVVSYENFDGDTWSNPLYDSWEKTYNGTKYSDNYEFDNIKQ